MTHRQQRGFTLIEMAIVLAVIGLIVGAIVLGQNLLRTAQLRAVVTEEQQYTQAISNFRDKYQALPGDFTGATALWGSVTGAVPTGGGLAGLVCFNAWAANAASYGTKTCDGDGNGQIANAGGIGAYTINNFYGATNYEMLMAWQHLANAGMIDGYKPISANESSPYPATAGHGIPASRLDGGGWCVGTITSYDTSNLPALNSVNLNLPYQTGDIPYNTYLLLEGAYSLLGFTCGVIAFPRIMTAPLLTTDEALSIDQKIDDGLPQTGKVVAVGDLFDGTYCSDGSTPPLYNVAQSGRQCALIFKTGL